MKSFNTIYVWIGASGGDWNDNVHNWQPGYPLASPPGYGDLVIFNNGVAETVIGNGAASEIDVVLGTTLTIKDSLSADGAVSGVGLMVDSGGTVIVANGATKPGVPGPGDVSVDVIGFQGAGALDVRAGGGMDDTGMVLGDRATGSGTLTVEGICIVAPAAAPNGLLIVGNAGSGVVTIQNGGSLSAVSGTVLGLQAGSTGTATLTGAGSTWLAGGLTVGAAGAGSITVQDGGALTTTFGSFIGFDDTASGAHGTGSVTIESGGTLTALTSLGIGSLGTFLVDDGSASANALTLSGGKMVVSNAGSVTTQTVTMAGGTINVLNGRELVDGGAAIAGTAGSVLGEPAVNFDALGTIIGRIQLNGALLATGTFTQNGGVNTVSGGGAKLEVGATGSGSYHLNLGKLSAPREMIGETGHGSFIQTGGINTLATGLLNLGTNLGGTGTYSLTNGALIALQEVVGGAGTGTFVQHSGSNIVAGVGSTLEVGVSGHGTYRLDHGTMTVTREWIGETGTGSFVQTGGTNTLTAGLLDLGTKTGGTGSYTLSLGKINALGDVVGDAGTGTFDQSGGTNTLSGDLVIGKAAGGVGSYDMTGGSLTIKDATGTTHTLSLGVNATATGEMTIATAKVSTPFLHLGHGNLTVETGGVLRVLHQVQIDSGSTLDATNGSVVIGKVVTPVADLIVVGATGVLEGAGTITGNLRDGLTGTVRAQEGTLTLTGDLSGSGKLQIADGGILDLQGTDPLGINFLGAAGVLRIEKTAAVAGTIGRLAVGDVIDLAGVTATHTGRVGGKLTVTESDGSKLILHVAGALTGNHFAISSDGAGGSNLTLTAPVLQADHFAFHPSVSITGSAELTVGHPLGIEALAAVERPDLPKGDVFGCEGWDHADQFNSLIQEGSYL